MPNPSSLPAGSDIGPTPDASTQAAVPTNTEGGPAIKQGSEAAAPGARKILPDVAEPVIEAIEEPAAGQAKTAPPPPDKEQPQDVTGDQKQIAPPGAAKEPAAGQAKAAPPPPDKEQPPDAKGDQKQIAPSKTAEECWPAIDCSKPHEVVDAAVTECMKTKYGAALVADMDDAQILLSYLTRNGLQDERKVKDETIQTLIAARQHLRTGVFDCEKEEAQFRKAYGIIAAAALPVTVVSLRDSLPTKPQRRWTFFMEGEPRSIAERTCFKYRDFAFAVLLLLLVFQVYWTISSSVLNKTDALTSEINKAPTQAVYLAQEAARKSAIRPANQPTTGETTPQKTTPPQTIPNETKVEKPQLTLDELVTKLAELGANYSMLSKLMAPVARFFFQPEDYTVAPHPVDADKGKQQKDGTAKAEVPEDIFIPDAFQDQSATVRAVAVQVIDVMQKWWLPLLYGTLGAMVFVVRTLSLQARDRLFRKEALVSLNLRVFLGAISGLAIGWFWNQNSQAPGTAGPVSVSALSPFALAFVAGYGVELFFTLLDKIVSAFTNKP